MRSAAPLLALLGAACAPAAPPPPRLLYAGLPVSGDLPLARRAGFSDCFNTDGAHLRCRRSGAVLLGAGPFEAAVDLTGGDGESGFSGLTLWRAGDQDAIYGAAAVLKRAGWSYCYTGSGQAGDQAIFRKPGQPVRLSLDISYYGKRRLRVLPPWNRSGLDRPCTPDASVLRFGTDVAQAAGE